MLFKLKDDYSGLCEQHSELEVKVKTSEMEIESQAKRCAQLESDIKGKVCKPLNSVVENVQYLIHNLSRDSIRIKLTIRIN